MARPGSLHEGNIRSNRYWAAFPWEALYSEAHCAWVGLDRTLSRIPGITAEAFRSIGRSRFGKGWALAAVVCPRDAMSHSLLPAAKIEAEQVSNVLRQRGYTLIGGDVLAGRSATKASMLHAIAEQPMLIHYSGHGAVRGGEEALVLSATAGTEAVMNQNLVIGLWIVARMCLVDPLLLPATWQSQYFTPSSPNIVPTSPD